MANLITNKQKNQQRGERPNKFQKQQSNRPRMLQGHPTTLARHRRKPVCINVFGKKTRICPLAVQWVAPRRKPPAKGHWIDSNAFYPTSANFAQNLPLRYD